MARQRRYYGDLQNDRGNFGTRDTDQARDPVCGMPVAMDTGFHSSHGGKDFYFCGSTCQQNFEDEPGQYLGEVERQDGGNASTMRLEVSEEIATEFGPTGVPGTGRSQRAIAEGVHSSTSGGGGDYGSSSGHFPYGSPGLPASGSRLQKGRTAGRAAITKSGYHSSRGSGRNH